MHSFNALNWKWVHVSRDWASNFVVLSQSSPYPVQALSVIPHDIDIAQQQEGDENRMTFCFSQNTLWNIDDLALVSHDFDFVSQKSLIIEVKQFVDYKEFTHCKVKVD